MSARDRQVGGDHYRKGNLEPWDIIDAFELDYYEGNVLKYLLRHRRKNGKQDIEKAIHYLEKVMEVHYGDTSTDSKGYVSTIPPVPSSLTGFLDVFE